MQAIRSRTLTQPPIPSGRKSDRGNPHLPYPTSATASISQAQPLVAEPSESNSREHSLKLSIGAHVSSHASVLVRFEQLLEKIRSPLVLSYQILGSWLLFFSAQPILGRDRTFTVPFIACAFILGIYLLNWLSEIKADFINDESRLLLLKNHRLYWSITIASLSLGVVVPTIMGKLHWSIPLLLVIGILYSFPLIPWYHKKSGWISARLKDIPGLKSLTVSSCYAAYVFGLPLIFSAQVAEMDSQIVWLIIGVFILNMLNTNFDDSLDIQSDKIEGVPTLPVLLGRKKFLNAFVAVNLIWISVIVLAFSNQALDGKHAGFLLAQAFLPFAWILTQKVWPERKFLLDILIESDLYIAALGFILIFT